MTNGVEGPSFDDLAADAGKLSALLMRRGWKLVTAESCTGGLIGAVCTSLAGSSNWFERGFITYSNEAKAEALGVPADLIGLHGAVSQEVAEAMAQGALLHSRADVSVAVTGIAGPGGATPGKPVGTVWLAVATKSTVIIEAGRVSRRAELLQLPGDRSAVRAGTVARALAVLMDACG